MTLNQQFAARLDKLGVRLPEILLPAPGVDLGAWSVVACDQYTSDHDYWNRVESAVGSAPSTLRLTLPEIYLESPDVGARIAAIQRAMRDYQDRKLLAPQGECVVYVERSTAASGLRQGIVLAMDLERYSYAPGSKSLIRATEGTIVERIPPRLAVRRAAPLELPHIMILIDDPAKRVVEGLAAAKASFKPLYDLELMEGGGRLSAYKIAEAAQVDAVLASLESLLSATAAQQGSAEPLFFAMGDGNHSLATAKARWEEIKQAELAATGSLDGLAGHPARFALAEIVNVHSPGLRFEPIHRAVFTAKAAPFADFLKRHPSVAALKPIGESAAQALIAGPAGQQSAVFYDGAAYAELVFAPSDGKLPTALVDSIYQDFKAVDPQAKIDFIHGWSDNKKLTGQGAVCFFLPVIARERLFRQVQEHGPLPRKAFSMGDAEEKRYYMEARRIVR